MHLIKLRTIQDKFPLNKSEAKGDFVILKYYYNKTSYSRIRPLAFQRSRWAWCHRYFLTKLHSLESSFQGGHASDLDGIWKC